MKLERFTREDHIAEWDDFVDRCDGSTILHTRRFLAYHGDRFEDLSLLVRGPHDRLLALLPAARDPEAPTIVVSHPGATFGGVLFDPGVNGEQALEILREICGYYVEKGFLILRYKAVPQMYHVRPAQADLYALFRLGAERISCGLSTTVDLELENVWSARRRRGLRRALRAGLTITTADRPGPFWRVVEEVLSERHDVRPVHTEQEILSLMQRFPHEIEIVTAELQGAVVAGTLLFHSRRVVHAQYIASDLVGRGNGALEGVFSHCLESARARGKRYFDFGVSTEEGGRRLNGGLEAFKREFGGGSTVYETFEIQLSSNSRT